MFHRRSCIPGSFCSFTVFVRTGCPVFDVISTPFIRSGSNFDMSEDSRYLIEFSSIGS